MEIEGKRVNLILREEYGGQAAVSSKYLSDYAETRFEYDISGFYVEFDDTLMESVSIGNPKAGNNYVACVVKDSKGVGKGGLGSVEEVSFGRAECRSRIMWRLLG